jgi:CHAT domain-containing protein
VADPLPVFRGHQDLDLATGEPMPLVLGRSGRIGVCLDPPPATDTSQWEARLLGGAFVAPAVRLDTTLCFEESLPENAREGRWDLCAVLRDRFDGRTQELPCVPFRVDADERTYREIEKGIPAALQASVASLDALADRAHAARLEALALRLRLVAAYALRRQGSSEAAERLRSGPPWIDAPAAARWAGQLAYERATLALEAQAEPAACWRLLREAERGFRVCGDRKWIAVVGKQADVLSRAGAIAEAKERLQFAVATCAVAPCDPPLVTAAQNTLAWLVASDPDAAEEELDSAQRSLEGLLAGRDAPADPLERANSLLNLAFVRERRGLDPDEVLGRARGLIATPASSRARELSGWADLVEARWALAHGDLARAAATGDRLSASAETARLRAFGAGCSAAAQRRLGALDRAGVALAEAPAEGRRAEDAYAAARIALESGRAEAAWGILRSLDAGTAARNPVPEIAALAELEGPSSGRRREQREAIRRGALDRMQDALRAERVETRPVDDAAVSFRAFPLDDEVVVLRRAATGEVATYRRTPMPRVRLVALVREVRAAMEREQADDARWAELVEPLARALAPLPEDLGEVTIFAAHGILQDVPLPALPVSSPGARRWLGELTAVAWRPAGVGGADVPAREGSRAALVVSDPRGDLGLTGAGAYGTEVLAGERATREALREALGQAERLHVDAHARYEPAFPELSTILLADGVVTGQELAAWSSGLALANLSGCQTGRAPITADSGRFGLAGLLAGAGVDWVVATRATLANALAVDFNRAFYAALAGGAEVPAAYRRGLDAARRRHPAARWGALVLLHGGVEKKRGQSSELRTPTLAGGVR